MALKVEERYQSVGELAGELLAIPQQQKKRQEQRIQEERERQEQEARRREEEARRAREREHQRQRAEEDRKSREAARQKIQQQTPVEETKKSSAAVSSVIALIVLLLVGGTVYLFTKSDTVERIAEEANSTRTIRNGGQSADSVFPLIIRGQAPTIIKTDADYGKEVATRFGRVGQVSDNVSSNKYLVVNGKPDQSVRDDHFRFLALFELSQADVLFLCHQCGGTRCAPQFKFLTIKNNSTYEWSEAFKTQCCYDEMIGQVLDDKAVVIVKRYVDNTLLKKIEVGSNKHATTNYPPSHETLERKCRHLYDILVGSDSPHDSWISYYAAEFRGFDHDAFLRLRDSFNDRANSPITYENFKMQFCNER